MQAAAFSLSSRLGVLPCQPSSAPSTVPKSRKVVGATLRAGSSAGKRRNRGLAGRKGVRAGPDVEAATVGVGAGTAGPWSVKNDYEEPYVLVSEDPEEVAKEIERIAAENNALRQQLDEMKDAGAVQAAEKRETLDPTRLRPPGPSAEVDTAVSTSTSAGQNEAKSKGAAEAGEPSTAKAMEVAQLARSELDDSNRTAKKTMSIVFVAAEAAPYSKTGGLADVCGSLPIALAERGHRVMVVTPRYQNGVANDLYKNATDANCRIKIGCFEGDHEVAFFHEFRDGVDWVFVDHPSYHRPGTPYGDSRGAFGDNQFRFTLLSLAACEAPLVLPLGGFIYGQDVVFVANDWHAGLVPVYIAAKYRRYSVYNNARCILAIHNLAHQGVEPAYTFGNLGLPGDWYGALEWVFPEWARAHELDKGEAVNVLKGAIVTADRILTVSQGYAWEITTAEGGAGLDGLLRSRSFMLNGVTNGIDLQEWSPSIDRFIPVQFSAEDLEGKKDCKAALQKELGLPVRADVPLIGFIGRLDYQKGPDIIQAALPELMSGDVQMVMLGSGDPNVEAWLTGAEQTWHDKFRGWVGFSVPVAHRITAGCDILLMPSRFEPCGLNQLYAMRYGTVPVVHSTGGLRDTVEDFNPFADNGDGRGTGWTFSPLTKDAMLSALWTTILTYKEHPESWRKIMLRGMTQDFSWGRAALQYEQLFDWAKMDKPYA